MGNIRFCFVIAFLLSGLIACGDQSERWPMHRFDRATWMQAKESERFVFVRDLVDRKTLLGMSKQQVVALLGPASSDQDAEKYLAYIVKADSGLVYLLDIRFSEDASRVVNKVLIRSD